MVGGCVLLCNVFAFWLRAVVKRPVETSFSTSCMVLLRLARVPPLLDLGWSRRFSILS